MHFYFQMCAPVALFFLDALDDLTPVAIQLYQAKGPGNPVGTEPRSWADGCGAFSFIAFGSMPL